jgi:hypothetical protein
METILSKDLLFEICNILPFNDLISFMITCKTIFNLRDRIKNINKDQKHIKIKCKQLLPFPNLVSLHNCGLLSYDSRILDLPLDRFRIKVKMENINEILRRKYKKLNIGVDDIFLKLEVVGEYLSIFILPKINEKFQRDQMKILIREIISIYEMKILPENALSLYTGLTVDYFIFNGKLNGKIYEKLIPHLSISKLRIIDPRKCDVYPNVKDVEYKTSYDILVEGERPKKVFFDERILSLNIEKMHVINRSWTLGQYYKLIEKKYKKLHISTLIGINSFSCKLDLEYINNRVILRSYSFIDKKIINRIYKTYQCPFVIIHHLMSSLKKNKECILEHKDHIDKFELRRTKSSLDDDDKIKIMDEILFIIDEVKPKELVFKTNEQTEDYIKDMLIKNTVDGILVNQKIKITFEQIKYL